MIRSIQLAIIQAFKALWEMKFEEMVAILNFHQKMKKNDNIHHVFIKSLWKSWLANVQYTQLVFQKTIKVRRSKIILCFSINHDFKLFLIYWMEWAFAYHDLMMDLVHTWWILSLLFICWWQFKMTTISSNFISQGAVKA
jgi:hypothetical protein